MRIVIPAKAGIQSFTTIILSDAKNLGEGW
jgi:hypothetical protein